jgi:hypothetical protein
MGFVIPAVAATLGAAAPAARSDSVDPIRAGAAQPPAEQRRPQIPRDHPDARVIDDFLARVEDYFEIHKSMEAKLTKLPEEATPEQIDKHQRALGVLIENARQSAKPGDLFAPPMQAYVRRELSRIFKGPEGKQLKASIMDENPAGTPLRVNARYPDKVPVSTMPPEVLAILPELPEELQYRFVDRRLALVDNHAHIIVDFVDNALPSS